MDFGDYRIVVVLGAFAAAGAFAGAAVLASAAGAPCVIVCTTVLGGEQR